MSSRFYFLPREKSDAEINAEREVKSARKERQRHLDDFLQKVKHKKEQMKPDPRKNGSSHAELDSKPVVTLRQREIVNKTLPVPDCPQVKPVKKEEPQKEDQPADAFVKSYLLAKHLSQFRETLAVQPKRHTEEQLRQEALRSRSAEQQKQRAELEILRQQKKVEFEQAYRQGLTRQGGEGTLDRLEPIPAVAPKIIREKSGTACDHSSHPVLEAAVPSSDYKSQEPISRSHEANNKQGLDRARGKHAAVLDHAGGQSSKSCSISKTGTASRSSQKKTGCAQLDVWPDEVPDCWEELCDVETNPVTERREESDDSSSVEPVSDASGEPPSDDDQSQASDCLMDGNNNEECKVDGISDDHQLPLPGSHTDTTHTHSQASQPDNASGATLSPQLVDPCVSSLGQYAFAPAQLNVPLPALSSLATSSLSIPVNPGLQSVPQVSPLLLPSPEMMQATMLLWQQMMGATNTAVVQPADPLPSQTHVKPPGGMPQAVPLHTPDLPPPTLPPTASSHATLPNSVAQTSVLQTAPVASHDDSVVENVAHTPKINTAEHCSSDHEKLIFLEPKPQRTFRRRHAKLETPAPTSPMKLMELTSKDEGDTDIKPCELLDFESMRSRHISEPELKDSMGDEQARKMDCSRKEDEDSSRDRDMSVAVQAVPSADVDSSHSEKYLVSGDGSSTSSKSGETPASNCKDQLSKSKNDREQSLAKTERRPASVQELICRRLTRRAFRCNKKVDDGSRLPNVGDAINRIESCGDQKILHSKQTHHPSTQKPTRDKYRSEGILRYDEGSYWRHRKEESSDDSDWTPDVVEKRTVRVTSSPFRVPSACDDVGRSSSRKQESADQRTKLDRHDHVQMPVRPVRPSKFHGIKVPGHHNLGEVRQPRGRGAWKKTAEH